MNGATTYSVATCYVQTQGRGTSEITAEINRMLSEWNAHHGMCHVFVHHTSASLIITENADWDVQRDLDAYMSRLVRDGDPIFHHTAEGPDDMSAHIRSVLTATTLTVPVQGGQCDLGTWQGIYLWEHRTVPHRRRLSISFVGGRGHGS